VLFRSFDNSRPLRPWLLTVVRNKARDLLRSEQKHLNLGEQRNPPDMATLNHRHEVTRQQIEDLLTLLHPAERKLTEEFYLEERTADEIADAHGLARSDVYRKLYQIRTKLRGRALPP